jgi:hypothetical protein
MGKRRERRTPNERPLEQALLAIPQYDIFEPPMILSADYICPARGLASLEPPDPERLLKAARAARDLGVERVNLPVLEESISGSVRATVKFLDGLVLALDRISEAGLNAWLVAPATRLMGVYWAPPYLVKGYRDPRANPVFVDGTLRRLHFQEWWNDPPLIGKRIRIFRELVSAVAGHPCLSGWVVLDRALEAVRPGPEPAEFVLRSFVAEIRERDETIAVHLGLGWSDLTVPEPALHLAPLVDGIRVAGDPAGIPGLPSKARLSDEMTVSSFIASIGLWLFGKPLEVQVGWGLSGGAGDPDLIAEEVLRLSAQGTSGLNWLSLIDPDPGTRKEIPWSSHPGLEETALFHSFLEPKEGAEEWAKAAHRTEQKKKIEGFIDVGREEYIEDPAMHLRRLWDHYREAV